MSDAESGNSELVLGAFTYVILFASIGGFVCLVTSFDLFLSELFVFPAIAFISLGV